MATPAELRWEPIVRQARRSGASIRAYAREHGINENTLAWWNWRFGDLDEPVFVEVDHETDLGLLRRVVEALS
jgi:transposase-like protein